MKTTKLSPEEQLQQAWGLICAFGVLTLLIALIAAFFPTLSNDFPLAATIINVINVLVGIVVPLTDASWVSAAYGACLIVAWVFKTRSAAPVAISVLAVFNTALLVYCWFFYSPGGYGGASWPILMGALACRLWLLIPLKYALSGREGRKTK